MGRLKGAQSASVGWGLGMELILSARIPSTRQTKAANTRNAVLRMREPREPQHVLYAQQEL